jgi:hypothetical protein
MYLVRGVLEEGEELAEGGLNAVDEVRNGGQRFEAVRFVVETGILSIVVHEHTSMRVRIFQQNEQAITFADKSSIDSKGEDLFGMD